MKKGICLLFIIILSIIGIGIVSCNSDDDNNDNENNIITGTLEFYANGEDFVREGFISKDGWNVEFDHVYVCLDKVTAYQTSPAYDPQTVGELDTDTIKVKVELGGPYIVDLAEGDASADPILIGDIDNAAVGSYNAISWSMVKATSGDTEGYPLLLMGSATKDSESIDFTISVEFEYSYSGGEYVSENEIKGVLAKDATANLEMTFHFDHLFGDFDVPADDHVNLGAVGFQPFVDIAVNSVVDVDMDGLKRNAEFSAEDYLMMMETLPTLGHVGEGHCHCEQWW